MTVKGRVMAIEYLANYDRPWGVKVRLFADWISRPIQWSYFKYQPDFLVGTDFIINIDGLGEQE